MKKNYLFLILGMFLLIGTLSLSSSAVMPFCFEGISVQTNAPSSITSSTVGLNGFISSNLDYALLAGFAYREKGQSEWTSIAGSFAWYSPGLLGQNYGYTLINLDPNTEYEYKAIVTQYNDGVNGYSYFCEAFFYYDFKTLIDVNRAEVTTLSPTSITDTTALLRADITSLGDSSSLVLDFGIRKQGGNWNYYPSSGIDVTSTGIKTYSMTGLDPNSNYEVVAWVFDDYGSIEADGISFNTQSGIPESSDPTISLNTVINIGQNSATIRGNIDSLGDYNNVDVKFFYKPVNILGPISPISASETTQSSTGGVQYGLTGLQPNTQYEYDLGYYNTDLGYYVLSGETTQKFTTLEQSYEWINTTKTNKTSIGLFDEVLTGLDPNTEYSFRACVVKDDFLSCNETLTFDTLSLTPPSVSTLEAIDITNSRALLKGNVLSLGDYASVIASFSFREVGGAYQTLLGSIQELSTTGEYSFEVTGLNENTTYEFYATLFEVDQYLIEATSKIFTTDLNPTIPPTEIENLPNIIMNFSDNFSFDLNNYYSFYDSIVLNISDLIITDGGGTLINNLGNPVLSINIANDRYINFTSHNYNETYIIYYNISNSYDSLERNFTLQILEGAETTPIIDNNVTFEGEGILIKISNLFMSLFPDNNDLNNSQKITIVVIVMILVSILIIGLLYATTKNITVGMMWLVLVINTLLFFFFAGIGYIPIGFIAVIGILLLAYGVLKVVRGRGD